MPATQVSWTSFARELAVLVPVGAAVWLAFSHIIHPALGLPSLAPVPARTLVVVLVVWWLLRRNGESWAGFGLCRPASIQLAVLLTVAFLAAKLWLVQPASDLVATALELPKSDHSFFDHIYGNPWALAGWLPVAWGVGGFADEIVFRGYLKNPVAPVLGHGTRGWFLAAFAQARLFGLGHAYLGSAGIISAAFTALAFAAFYLLAGRNLWPVIIVHGTWDTGAVTLIYLYGVPSTG